MEVDTPEEEDGFMFDEEDPRQEDRSAGDSPFCSVKTTIAVRQSRSIEDREIGKQFAPLWRTLADQLTILFPDGDDEGAFFVPALDTRSQVFSVEGRRNGIGKPVFKLASFGSGQ